MSKLFPTATTRRYMIDAERIAAIALASVLTCQREDFPLSEDTRNEARLAHSLLTVGEPTVDELKEFLGSNWAITRRRDHPNPITNKRYFVAKVKALAKRLGVSEGFIQARIDTCQREDFAARVAVRDAFAIVITGDKAHDTRRWRKGHYAYEADARNFIESERHRCASGDKLEIMNILSGAIVYTETIA